MQRQSFSILYFVFYKKSSFPVLNRYHFSTIMHQECKLVTLWYKDFTATSLSGEKMMTLSRRILSLRNLIYANIFVSASSWLQQKSILSLLWLVTRSAASPRFAKLLVWNEVKTFGNVPLHFFRKDNSLSWFYCSNSQGNSKMTLEAFGYQ